MEEVNICANVQHVEVMPPFLKKGQKEFEGAWAVQGD